MPRSRTTGLVWAESPRGILSLLLHFPCLSPFFLSASLDIDCAAHRKKRRSTYSERHKTANALPPENSRLFRTSRFSCEFFYSRRVLRSLTQFPSLLKTAALSTISAPLYADKEKPPRFLRYFLIRSCQAMDKLGMDLFRGILRIN